MPVRSPHFYSTMLFFCLYCDLSPWFDTQGRERWIRTGCARFESKRSGNKLAVERVQYSGRDGGGCCWVGLWSVGARGSLGERYERKIRGIQAMRTTRCYKNLASGRPSRQTETNMKPCMCNATYIRRDYSVGSASTVAAEQRAPIQPQSRRNQAGNQTRP